MLFLPCPLDVHDDDGIQSAVLDLRGEPFAKSGRLNVESAGHRRVPLAGAGFAAVSPRTVYSGPGQHRMVVYQGIDRRVIAGNGAGR